MLAGVHELERFNRPFKRACNLQSRIHILRPQAADYPKAHTNLTTYELSQAATTDYQTTDYPTSAQTVEGRGGMVSSKSLNLCLNPEPDMLGPAVYCFLSLA